jgi:hypothetical protein
MMRTAIGVGSLANALWLELKSWGYGVDWSFAEDLGEELDRVDRESALGKPMRDFLASSSSDCDKTQMVPCC